MIYYLGSHQDLVSIQGKLKVFAEHLKQKYPDYKQYELYYLLIGSAPHEHKPFFDFPDQNSVRGFIESLLKS